MVTSKVAAEGMLTTRVYPIPDHWEITENDFAASLLQLVQPDSWDQLGGPGAFKSVRGGVLVSNTAEVHDEIEKLCEKFDLLYEQE